MAKLLKLRRGNTSQHGSFTGAEGEVTVDTDKETLVVHDGSTAGGHPVAAEDMANVSSASIAGRLANDSIATSKIAAGALPSDVTIVNANVDASAAIAPSKLASGTLPSGITVASANIVDGTIVNADINASAAIGLSKLATGALPTGITIARNNLNSSIIKNSEVAADAAIARTKLANVDVVDDTSPQLGGDLQSNGNDIDFADNDKAIFGTAGDLEIYHDGSHSNIVDTGTGNLRLFGNSQIFLGRSVGGEAYATFNSDGSVNLYHNNSVKFETTSGGASVTGNLDVSNGADVTGDLTVSGTINSGAHTVTGNLSVTGEIAATSHIDIPDNAIIKVGTGDDLQIYHNGTAGYIDSTGNDTLFIRNGTSGGKIKIQGNSGEDSIICNHDGSVELYYDNSKKFETISAGASVTGNLAVTGTVDGRDVAADGSKLDNIENNATADQTTSEILTLINSSDIYTSTGAFGISSSNNIDFTTDSRMSIHINGSEEFRFEADGDFHADGDVYAFSTTVSSDENLKKDITIVSDAVTKVEALKGVTFKWKKNDADSAGVIAQDVEKVLPEVVKTVNDMEGNEYKAVNYAGLTSILIEAVKDLSARIKVLEAK